MSILPEINQQATQCDEIAKVILANKKLPDHIAGVEGWKDMKVTDAIYKAAETGEGCYTLGYISFYQPGAKCLKVSYGSLDFV